QVIDFSEFRCRIKAEEIVTAFQKSRQIMTFDKSLQDSDRWRPKNFPIGRESLRHDQAWGFEFEMVASLNGRSHSFDCRSSKDRDQRQLGSKRLINFGD